MEFLKEFKEFILRGNVLDLAIGVIIGASFGKITTSLVNDVLMPPLGLLIGGVRFDQLKLVLKAADGDNSAVTLNYGLFLQTVVDFILIAWAVFILVKIMNHLYRKKALAPAAGTEKKEVILLEEIRDLLKK